MSSRNHTVPFAEPQQHVVNSANPGGALDDGVEDWLHVRRRAADDAEHLGCSRLMFKGLAQLCVALLQFFEQPYVLDGDDGLGSKRFEKLDLVLRERADLVTTRLNVADRYVFSHERNAEGRSKSSLARESTAFWKFFYFGLKIRDVEHSPFEHGATA